MLFFAKPAIGLDISDSSIEAVYVTRKGERLVLASYGRVVLPAGIVVGGNVVRQDDLVVILRRLLTKQMTPPILGASRVVFSLPETKVFSHVFEVPIAVEESELVQTLSIEADGYFPYNHREMVSGLAVIDERLDKKQVYFAAVQRETLTKYLELFAKCGLEVAVAEGEATSMARAIFRRDEPEAAILVDVGARVTTLAVFDHRGIQFSESLPLAGDAFTTAVAAGMSGQLDVAEELKRTSGLLGGLAPAALRNLTAKVNELVAVIGQAVDYYEARSGRQVKRAYFCGGSMLMPGLFERVKAALAERPHPVEAGVADIFGDLTIDPALEAAGIRNRGVLLPTAIGLGLRGAGVSKFLEIDFLHGAEAPVRGPASAAPAPLPGVKPVSRGFRHWSKPLQIGLIVLAVIATAALAWAIAFWGVPKLASFRGAPKASAPGVVDVNFDFTIGSEATSLPDRHLQATYLQATTEVSNHYQRQVARTPGWAKGRVVIHNDSVVSRTLIATTRLVSESGVVFRLDSRVTIRARGTAEADITADQAGASGNVGPGRWTMPGLSAADQAKIYGVSSAAMTGGEALSGAPVSQEELDRAKAELAALAATDLRRQLADQATAANLRYLEATYHQAGEPTIEGPKVGDLVAEFDLKLTLEATEAAYSEEELRQLVSAVAAEAANGQVLGAPGALNPEVVEADPVVGTATLRLVTQVSRK